MARFTKADIERHSDGVGRRSSPAINVKCYRFVDPDTVIERFQCSQETAERAVEFARDAGIQQFWEQITDTVQYYLNDSTLKAWSEGRSDGWLVVEGLPEIENWDAILVSRWGRLAKAVRNEIEYLSSDEYTLEAIEANQWYKEGSEEYNFIDSPSGRAVCIADLNAYLARHRAAYLASI